MNHSLRKRVEKLTVKLRHDNPKIMRIVIDNKEEADRLSEAGYEVINVVFVDSDGNDRSLHPEDGTPCRSSQDNKNP